jgi:hypothetical protein
MLIKDMVGYIGVVGVILASEKKPASVLVV